MQRIIDYDKLERDNIDYIVSGKWRCSSSPTGSHFWDVLDTHWECRHCHEKRNETHKSLQYLVPQEILVESGSIKW